LLFSLCAAGLAGGCATTPEQPLPAHPSLELQRFMGDWYVIANIPTSIERGAHNAIESYRLAADGTIDTTFVFRKGGFDGPEKRYNPRGFVRPNTGNAIWGMRFVWPIKAEYIVAYVDAAYSQTIIARSKRDYVWIMARTPSMTPADYAALVERVRAMGYDVARLQRVPQQWPSSSGS
jgi:apolipoprotein D and lipocalin family protein